MVKEVLTSFDSAIHMIIHDYENFCIEEKLIDNADTQMRAVAVGDTLKQNLTYHLYYAPTMREYQDHQYMVLYHKKAIRAIRESLRLLT